MATTKWIGAAKAVAQVNTVTPASPASGNTFSVTINGKTLTYTAGQAGDTVSVGVVCSGLAALINKARTLDPEWAEVTCENLQTYLRLTAVVPGKPFTQTSSSANGTGGAGHSNTTATATANSGPNVWGTTANWDTGTVPVDGDDVVIETPVSILYDLDQSAIEPATLKISASFTARIGLPEMNSDTPGLPPYREYRSTHLSLGPVAATIGYGGGDGSGHIRLNTTTDPVTLTVLKTALEPLESGHHPLEWYGDHANNVLTVLRGRLGVGTKQGQTTTLSALNVGFIDGLVADSSVTCGENVTVTTLRQSGGNVSFNGTITTIVQSAGNLHLNAAGTVTTVTVSDRAKFYVHSAQTITTLWVYPGAYVLFSADPRTRTVATCYLVVDALDQTTAKISDPTSTVTFTNGIIRTYGSAAIFPTSIGV